MASSVMSFCTRFSRLGAQCRSLVPAVAATSRQLQRSLVPTVAATSRQLHTSQTVQLRMSSLLRGADDKVVEHEEENEMVPEQLYSKIRIKVKGADFRVLDSYCRFVITAGKVLDIHTSGRICLPTHIQKFTVLKSVHIYKKHRVQYEIRTHVRQIQIWEVTGTTADVFLEYIQRNLPEGVSMAVYMERMDTLPLLLLGPQGDSKPTTPDKKRK